MQQCRTAILTTLFLFLFMLSWLDAQETGGPYTPDANTILLMHFDGNLTNSSALSGDGSQYGTGASYSSDVPPNLDQCLSLDGTSFITIPHNNNLSLTGDWTIEAWIKLTAFNSGTQSVIVRKPGDTDRYYSNYALEVHPWWGNIFHGFYFADEATRINAIEMSPNLNQWYHIAFKRNSESSAITLTVRDENLEIVSSSSNTFTNNEVLLSSQDLRIGEGLIGYIDEVRVSNVVRDFTQEPTPFPEELDIERMDNKINALNLHRMKYDSSPYSLTIDVLQPIDYEAQKPAGALPFDCGYVDANGWVYVSEPTTAEQLSVFTDINQAAIYYMCQSFLQYYYQATEMPLWFKSGFASYEADIRLDDADIKTAYNNYGGTITSFDALNGREAFTANNGFAISYMFGEFMGVLKIWDYRMLNIVDENTIAPVAWWDIESANHLFEIWKRYFDVRILEENELNRIKLGRETGHFKFYYRGAEEFWAEYFSGVLEEAITEYMSLYDFEVYEKFSYITMPECDFAEIGGRECINRYTGGTAWSSGLSTTSPINEYDFERFRRLIRHELGHLAQCHLPANNMTAWLNEGSAQFISHGPLSQEKIDGMQQQATETLANAINYYGHLPTFEETKNYTSTSDVDYYLLGEYMLNFIYSISGYEEIKEILIDHETGILNLGFATLEDFMDSYYNYVNTVFLKIEEPGYFSNYDDFIAKLTGLTSSADSSAKLNVFWNALTDIGNFPFVIDTNVAFLYRGSANTINWAGMFNNWDLNADAGILLGVSDIWMLEKEFPADTRCEYKIVANGSEWFADPNNPHPLAGDYENSELWMPDYSKHTELVARPEIPKGTLGNNILINSTNLGYSCQYRVYTPAGYSALSNLPAIYVADGQNYLDDSMGKMVTVLDNLIADGIINPVIAVFLDPRDPVNLSFDRRGDEYRSNINFVNYVTRELVPGIDAAYKTNATADARGIMGASYGGYNAAYFCVKASEFFHMAGMNSSYLHPREGYTIDDDMQAANLDVMKLYMSYGTFDADGEKYFDRLKNIFDQKGKEFKYDIIGDGHTWHNWSRLVGSALEYFFPKIETTSPHVTNIPDQTINEGSSFAPVQLDDFVTDPDNETSEIAWSYSGNSELSVAIDGNRVATVTIPNAEWYGSETITFTATDPENTSSSNDAVFTVKPVNDTPVISGAPELIEFVSDTSFTIDIWELISDVETSSDSLSYDFSIDSDSILISYDDGTGILTLSAVLEFGGEGNLIWSVSDSEEIVEDTIRVVVEKAVIVGIIDEMVIPKEYVLHQNYPNPFNPSTMIKYGIPEQSNVRIEVFNMLGQSVGLLINSEKSAGYYETTWDASNLPSGIYLISISAKGLDSKKNFIQVKKALLLK